MLERGRRDNQARSADEVGDADVVGRVDRDALEVAEALGAVRVVSADDDEHAAGERAERGSGSLGRRRLVARRIADRERAAVGVHGQRRAERLLARLAVDLRHVAAWLGTERDTAAVAVGRRERAGASAAGALLAECLGRGHRDLAARERRRSAVTARVELGGGGAVYQAHVELLAEDLLVEVDRAGLAEVRRCLLRHLYASVLISTTEPLAPGTEPRSRTTFWSGSTSTISRPRWVTRLLPIWPGPRMPLNTRDGVADAPIEPGARTLCEPWLAGPRLKLWRLMVPWKPLPLLTPETRIFCPASKASAVTVSPTCSSPASS